MPCAARLAASASWDRDVPGSRLPSAAFLTELAKVNTDWISFYMLLDYRAEWIALILGHVSQKVTKSRGMKPLRSA